MQSEFVDYVPVIYSVDQKHVQEIIMGSRFQQWMTFSEALQKYVTELRHLYAFQDRKKAIPNEFQDWIGTLMDLTIIFQQQMIQDREFDHPALFEMILHLFMECPVGSYDVTSMSWYKIHLSWLLSLFKIGSHNHWFREEFYSENCVTHFLLAANQFADNISVNTNDILKYEYHEVVDENVTSEKVFHVKNASKFAPPAKRVLRNVTIVWKY